jgi:hypothetical protein
MRTIRIESQAFIYTPGFFRWIREAVAPYDRRQAFNLLEGLGFGSADAVYLSDHKNPVTATTAGETLVLELPTEEHTHERGLKEAVV